MISELITNYLEANELSYRGLAKEICRQLDDPDAVSYQSVSNWVHGEFNPHLLKFRMLARYGNGSLKVLAQDILKELDANLIAE